MWFTISLLFQLRITTKVNSEIYKLFRALPTLRDIHKVKVVSVLQDNKIPCAPLCTLLILLALQPWVILYSVPFVRIVLSGTPTELNTGPAGVRSASLIWVVI